MRRPFQPHGTATATLLSPSGAYLTGRMRVAIVIPQRGFKDESLSAVSAMLSKWHVEAVVASYSSGDVTGYHGAVVRPDVNAALVKAADFDALVLIDGPGVDQCALYDFRPLLDTVRMFQMSRKLVAGIGNAVKIIARANVIANTKIAAPRDVEAKRLATLYKGVLTANHLEFDKGILTLNDPEKAEEFASRLIERLGVK